MYIITLLRHAYIPMVAPRARASPMRDLSRANFSTNPASFNAAWWQESRVCSVNRTQSSEEARSTKRDKEVSKHNNLTFKNVRKYLCTWKTSFVRQGTLHVLYHDGVKSRERLTHITTFQPHRKFIRMFTTHTYTGITHSSCQSHEISK